MGTASFKSFGYVGQTTNTRVPIDAVFNVQQTKAGFDSSEHKRVIVSNKNMVAVQTRLVKNLNIRQRRFIM